MKALAAALVEAQGAMPAVRPDSRNPHFGNDFVSLDHLIAKTKPVLTKHGLTIVQLPSNIDGHPALATTLIHAASGESITDTVPLVLAKQDMQGLGAALTYARRYAWAAALGICDEADDDGNAASAPGTGASQGSAPTNTGEWRWPFGKHKGKTLAETDRGYLDWFLEKSDKEDIKDRVREFLNLSELASFGGSDDGPDSDVPF